MMRTKIIYEDEQVLVCHKPAGLATQSGRVGQADMVSELKRYLADRQKKAVAQAGRHGKQNLSGQAIVSNGREKTGEPYLGIIHRLDQPVEGLLVFAKTRDAAAKLTAQLGKGSLNKQYYAVVCGKPEFEAGRLENYLVKEKDMARVSENGVAEKEAKQAILQYRVLSGTVTDVSGAEQRLSLLDIHIDTGRFHQIRVQMAHAGWPLLGDSKYGSELSLAISQKQGVRNVALFAYRVAFLHPQTNKKLEFQIEPDLPFGFGKNR